MQMTMEPAMMLTKDRAIAAAVAIGMSVSAPFATTAFANPPLAMTAMQSDASPQFHNGDLVRLRMGGPLMTIRSLQSDQANCIWSEPDGELRSGQFPVALLTAP